MAGPRLVPRCQLTAVHVVRAGVCSALPAFPRTHLQDLPGPGISALLKEYTKTYRHGEVEKQNRSRGLLILSLARTLMTPAIPNHHLLPVMSPNAHLSNLQPQTAYATAEIIES